MSRRSNILAASAFGVPLLAVVALLLWLVLHYDDRKDGCNEAGGVMVRGQGGSLCITSDVVIDE